MQMDHFDRYLETSLAHMLDPVVEGPAPPRRRSRRELPFHALIGGLATPLAEAVPTSVPVAIEPTVL